MRVALLAGKMLVYVYLGYLLLFLATTYMESPQASNQPILLWLAGTIDLFIHEAGHFFFRPFGRWLYVLGGSLLQVLLPLSLAVVTYLRSPKWMALPTFWTGQNMINVSVYILDAPHRKLKLIGKGLIHDWWWLLRGDLDVAEPLGMTVFILGILVCAAGIAAGLLFAIRTFREDVDTIPDLATLPARTVRPPGESLPTDEPPAM